jgi:glycerol kinase
MPDRQKRCVLALDQGTTSSRAAVFDGDCRLLALAQQEFRQIFPRPGWVEHDAEEIWATQSAAAGQALARAGMKAADVAAVGITNQRETTVIWDRTTGRPIHNAIVWQDRRTAAHCDQLRSGGAQERVSELTGLVLDPYFSATKVAWLLDHIEGARTAAAARRLAMGTIDSWLIYRLTGGRVHVTDSSNASRTMLFNIHTSRWDPELLDLFGVPGEILPTVVPSSKIVGEVTEPPELAGIPIAGIAGDQQAALMGQLCTEPGMAKNTYGTGCFALLNTGVQAVQSRHRLLTTVAWQRGGRTEYALEGSVFDAGSAIQWLRDGLGIIGASADVNRLAASVPDSGGVFFVPAFSGLGAPHWDAYARGTIIGLTRGASAAHLARATLEGIAFQVADVLEAMSRDAGTPLRELRVDGGASASDLLMQFQADLLQRPLARPQLLETTAMGAAYLAGLATGYWSDTGEIARHTSVDRRFEPQMAAARAAELREQWSRSVQRAKEWVQPG